MAMLRRGGSGPDPDPDPDPAVKKSAAGDAYWSYRPIEYVPPGPPLEHSLFDRDADDLEDLYRSAVTSMAVSEPDEVVKKRVQKAERLLESLGRARTSTPPDIPG